jgi:hypothetical protein
MAVAEPESLKVGDLVRFVAIPDEWLSPGCTVHAESIAFMKKMVRRSWPTRVSEIDEYGHPWIHARIRERGRMRHHSWAIMESTGWRLVKRQGGADERG